MLYYRAERILRDRCDRPAQHWTLFFTCAISLFQLLSSHSARPYTHAQAPADAQRDSRTFLNDEEVSIRGCGRTHYIFPPPTRIPRLVRKSNPTIVALGFTRQPEHHRLFRFAGMLAVHGTNANAAAFIELALPTLTNDGCLRHRARLKSLGLENPYATHPPLCTHLRALCRSHAGFCSGTCPPGHMYKPGRRW